MAYAPEHLLSPSLGGPPAASADPTDVLDDLRRYLAAAWESFERPRPREPRADADLVSRLGGALPQAPGTTRDALDDAVNILEASVSPSRPLFLAYIGSTGLETGVLASALSAAYDANLATAAGAADLLDGQAVRWVAEFVGYPAAEGHFTSGGQTSNFTALLAAREHALPGAREQGSPAEGHRLLLGRGAPLRRAGRGGGGAGAAGAAPDPDRREAPDAAGRAAAGSDGRPGGGPRPGRRRRDRRYHADRCGRPARRDRRRVRAGGVWLHVDGAYGLPAAATRTAAHLFAGLDRADSVTVDAHKWLGVQKSCSVVLLRRRGPLRAAFGHEEHYMLHEEDTGNPVDHTFEYSRPFRSLRLWLSLRVHGAARFRTWIESTLANAALLGDEVRAHASFELLHEPMLSTVCFRHVVPGMDDEGLDAHNERLARAMQADGRVFLAPAVVDGRTCLRACFVNFRTTTDAVQTVLEVADELGMSLAR